MLNTIIEGVSMSKWEMNNLLGKDNNNQADYCSCKGGTQSDNTNVNKGCKCSSKMTAYSYSEINQVTEETAYSSITDSVRALAL